MGAAVAAMLTLAGCSLLRPAKPAPAPEAPPPQTLNLVAPPRPRPRVVLPSTGSAAAAGHLGHPTPAPASASVAPSAPGSASAPVEVVGLSQDAVRKLLGPPAAESAQGPARTWTYAGAGCRVEIAFYFDVTRSGFFALSERLDGGGDGGPCLARIHDGRLS